jgi:hypothetical protein
MNVVCGYRLQGFPPWGLNRGSSSGSRRAARIAADLDALARQSAEAEAGSPAEPADPRTRHRRRLAEPAEKPRGRTAKEQREALRKAFGLPLYDGDYAEYFRHTPGTNT